jgi:hypothetical protein
MAAAIDHVQTLKMSRAKLVEKRRAMAKRDSITDRDEGFSDRIVAIQTALAATDLAIAEEEEFKVIERETENLVTEEATAD